jgi:hypothetical protein
MRRLIGTGAVLLCGCVPGFRSVYPGMTSEQVVTAMGRGPERTQLFDATYSAWYFDEDHCLLMQGNQVIDKQQSLVTDSVDTLLGGYQKELKAECVPPGVTRSNVQQKQVDTLLGSYRATEPPVAPPADAGPPPSTQAPPPAN